MRLEIIPVTGLPEIVHGDDLGALIAQHAEIRAGDVVVVAQKAVSKAEGRVVAVDPNRREEERRRIVEMESVRVLTRRGDTVIVQTSHGFVCANAGVDASNVPRDRLALLPVDPDGSASLLCGRLQRLTSCSVGVVIADTFGRPWRIGQTNVALGVAGIRAVRDHRGEKDAFGQELNATVIAVADEIAGAAELVMGKSDGIPVAIVRGLEGINGTGSARDLIRSAAEDLFPSGAVEVVEQRRSVRRFTSTPIPEEVVARAVQAATTAPAPHGSRVARPWKFVWLRSDDARRAFLTEMAAVWRRDLAADGTDPETIERRLQRSWALLGDASVLLACFVSLEGMDRYITGRHARANERQRAERDMFVAASGAALQNLMVALSAQGVGSCWISSSIFCPEEAARALRIEPGWQAVGCVAAGYPADRPTTRAPRNPGDFLDIR